MTSLQTEQRGRHSTESISTGIRQDSEYGLKARASAPVPGDLESSAWRRVMHGIGWNVFGSIAAQGGTFLSSILVARLIGKQLFGQFAMIQSTVIALTSLAALGLGITATKYVSQYRTIHPEKAGRILGLSSMTALLAAVCFCAGLVLFAPSLAKDPAYVTELRLSAIYVFFFTLNGYQVGALAGLEAFKRLATISVVTGPFAVLLTWVLASRFGIRGAVLAQGGNALFVWLLYQIALAKEGCAMGVRVQYRGMWKERSALIRFSIPATGSAIIGSSCIWWCNTILVRTNGYSEMALFAAANNLRVIVVLFPALIARVTAPILNNLLAGGDGVEYRRLFRGALAVNTAIALLLAVLLFCAQKQILHLFGKEFVGSASLVILLLSSAVVEVVACNLYQTIFAAGHLWWQVAIISVWATILAGVSVFSIPRYGAAGLALSNLVAMLASSVLYGRLAWLQQSRSSERVKPQ